jgi:hypothetical protein
MSQAHEIPLDAAIEHPDPAAQGLPGAAQAKPHGAILRFPCGSNLRLQETRLSNRIRRQVANFRCDSVP